MGQPPINMGQSNNALTCFFESGNNYDRYRQILLNKTLLPIMPAPRVAIRYCLLPHIDACAAKKYPFLDCPHAATGARGM
jgi:hypothetical protein